MEKIRRLLPLLLLAILPLILFVSNFDNINRDFKDNIIETVENRTEAEYEYFSLKFDIKKNEASIQKYRIILYKDETLLIGVEDGTEAKIELEEKIAKTKSEIETLGNINIENVGRIAELEKVIRNEDKGKVNTFDNMSIISIVVNVIFLLIGWKFLKFLIKLIYDQINNRIAGNWQNRHKDWVITFFWIIFASSFWAGIYFVANLIGLVNGYLSIYNWILGSVIVGDVLYIYSTSVERQK